MSDKSRFFALAARHDIEVDQEPDIQWLQVYSPPGKIFNTSGCHLDAGFQNILKPSGLHHDWPAAYRELQHIIDHGFQDCPDGGECEMCRPIEPTKP